MHPWTGVMNLYSPSTYSIIMVHSKIMANFMSHYEDCGKSCTWIWLAHWVGNSQLSNYTIMLISAHPTNSGKTHCYSILHFIQVRPNNYFKFYLNLSSSLINSIKVEARNQKGNIPVRWIRIWFGIILLLPLTKTVQQWLSVTLTRFSRSNWKYIVAQICKPDNCCKDHHGSTFPSSQWKYQFLVANLVRGRLLGCRSCNSTPTFSLPHQHLTFLNQKIFAKTFQLPTFKRKVASYQFLRNSWQTFCMHYNQERLLSPRLFYFQTFSLLYHSSGSSVFCQLAKHIFINICKE